MKELYKRRVETAKKRIRAGTLDPAKKPLLLLPDGTGPSKNTAEAMALGIDTNLSVSMNWIAQHAPNIVNERVDLGPPVLTPQARHAKRTLTAVVQRADGQAEEVQGDVIYSTAKAEEQQIDKRKRLVRARGRERRAVMALSCFRSTTMGLATEPHATISPPSWQL